MFVMMVCEDENYDNSGILIMENRMGISHSAFGTIYPVCKQIVSQYNACNGSDEDIKELHKTINIATKIILCLNGENNTAYTLRKRLFDLGKITDFEEELHFVKLLNLKFKKSSVAWAYRKHILMKVFENCQQNLNSFDEILRKELRFHEKISKKYPRNYYAWSYRRFLVDEFYHKAKKFDSLMSEYESIKNYCERNIHEYCAFHYLQHLIKVLWESIKVNDELDWTVVLIKKFEEYYGYENAHQNLTEVNYQNLESLKKHLKFLQFLKEGKIKIQ